jgi:hypothetical protein
MRSAFTAVRPVLLLCLALSALAAGWLVYSEPHVRAYACPPCLGFREVAPRIHVDQHATDAQIASALSSFDPAESLVLQFYPDRASNPLWLLCLSGECGIRTAPRPLAMIYLDRFVFVYPEGATPTILAHEMAHAELHHRVGGVWRVFSQAVPTWFDEGLAVFISRDPRYVTVEDGRVTGCRAGNWSSSPSDQRTFRHLGATKAEEIYTASACRTIQWLDRHGGAEAVLEKLQEIRGGTPFAE